MCLSKVVHDQLSARDHWLHRRGWKVFKRYEYSNVEHLYSPYQRTFYYQNDWVEIPLSQRNKVIENRISFENVKYGMGFHFYRYKTDAEYLCNKLIRFTDRVFINQYIIKPIYFKDPLAYGKERDAYGHKSLVGVARQIYICDAHSSENKFKAFPNGVA